ncbi:ribosome-associated translation inhibitor RaiA [Streptococcus suis]|nr:ribosome-associated translation inhibitor RaiA [Streptococcus suis]
MIKFSIRGENLEVTDALRTYVEEKVAKIEKYFNEEQELNAKVNLKVYRDKRAKVEVTIPVGAVTLRAEDISQEMYGSIDLVVDKIERKHRQKVATGQVFTDELVEQTGEEVKVVRTKQVDLKPMDMEEAVLQLELLGHDFFIYTDANDGTTNVLYRREDGDLGLLEVRQ